MNFTKSDIWYLIIPFLLAVVAYSYYFNIKYKNWINDNWFLVPNYYFKISKLFYFLFVLLIFTSLFDLRGREERVSSNVPDQKTVILIDVSSSMLAEDLRPNRFRKALMLARHFAKTSLGHQISLVLFSDFQKRVVPFTDDVDLLEARLAGFEDLDIRSGGSNLTQAISESVKYFYEAGNNGNVIGNILVFTDSEEHDEGTPLKVPDGISVAIVGVGTTRGGTIPLRDRTNIYRGNKTYKGEDVVSKLNEKKLREYSKSIKNYKYWVASTYSLPTEEILQFFRNKFKEKMSKGEVYIRPVMAHKVIIPAIICFVLYFLFSRFRQFRSLAIFLLIVLSSKAFSNDFKNLNNHESADAKKIEQKLFEGRAKKSERLKLAELYLKNKDAEKAQKLYDESGINVGKDSDEDIINFATSLLSSGKKREAFEIYSEVIKKLKSKKDLSKKDIENLNVIRNNSLQSSKSQDNKDQDKEKSKDQKKDQNKDQKKNEDEDKGKGKSGPQDQNQRQQEKSEQDKKDPSNKNDNENMNKDKKNENDKEEKEKEKEDKNKKDKNKENEKNQSLDQKEEQIKKQRKMVKVPALLKQLMNNDRSLQKRMFDTTTQQGKSHEQKDW